MSSRCGCRLSRCAGHLDPCGDHLCLRQPPWQCHSMPNRGGCRPCFRPQTRQNRPDYGDIYNTPPRSNRAACKSNRYSQWRGACGSRLRCWMLKMTWKRGLTTGAAWPVTLPPVHKILYSFSGGEWEHRNDGVGSERHGLWIFFTHEYRQASFPHAAVMVDDTSEHKHAATDCIVVRNEKLVERLGDLAERDLEVKNTIGSARHLRRRHHSDWRHPAALVTASGGAGRGQAPAVTGRYVGLTRCGSRTTGAAPRGGICCKTGACCNSA